MSHKDVFFRVEGALKRIHLDEILFLETSDNYVKFFALDYYHMVRVSLDAALEQMKDNRFVRVHRCYAVSLDHVDLVEREYVLFKSTENLQVPVSKQYYNSMIKRVTIIGNSRE